MDISGRRNKNCGTVTLFIAVSLDGYNRGQEHGGVEWLQGTGHGIARMREQEPDSYAEFIRENRYDS